MRNNFLFLSSLILLFFCLTITASASTSLRLVNRIEGTIYGPERRPLEDVYVELRNEVDTPISQSKTNSSGRFTFSGMPAGRYTIKALPLRTNFAEQTQEVYITNVGLSRTDVAYVEFYLNYTKRPADASNDRAAEAIFVQEIPPPAQKLYEEGLKDLKKNDDGGLGKLEEALKIFPNYFDALARLGKEYVLRKDYEKAYPYLLRSIDVNSRSFSSYYRLGYAFYQLKQYPAALKAAQSAATLVPDSTDAQLLYGTTLRINGKLADAETVLLKANSLAKEKSPEIHWQLALLYNRLNRNKDAISELETFLKLDPNSPEKAEIEDLMARLRTSSSGSK